VNLSHEVNKVDLISVRTATKDDVPPYSTSKDALLLGAEILVAEKNGKVSGAISISSKSIKYVTQEWAAKDVLPLPSIMQEISGPWISRLYVFPEHRHQGIGTELVKESVEYLRNKGLTGIYVGIYINNAFKAISHKIFKTNGFKQIGSCVCLLPKGFCQGILLKKTILFSQNGAKNYAN